MQDLDIISVNIWHIVISLANLVILFLILKKLLFKPVKKIVDKRQKEIESEYKKAEKTQAEADAIKAEWEGKMATAEAEADKIISDAVERADSRNEVMLYESREKADQIIRKAKADIERERKDARETIKKEIVDVSQTLSEQIIGREINMDDHRDLIDKAIDKIGEEQ
ncbi:MAG: F0F1 ATP synthase subunit B [Clostridiales bacterium]|jgi:ATP synthase, F0 subunit b|uniref:F0F1 ATP synthase subunit B n=1 Tax=Butyrivibrio sp. AE2032 TaxID=1458463 RepID=UPI00048FAD68|nr:F0F1 ATP synthase subunit B [Butyrivibrio sp. AE2032]MBQ1575313.1 F0F1 ATP synthase subunit B [Clostridiales bacterium]MBQ1743872.1 F0F1 ATP synthase subunit B [Clostridiales bacterium]MBQ5767434.1 F0F1 ATP synthase subunit B [Clostridiales bacterium]MBR0394937.1 F0F1 ATP synthase subunit B [Clostridiales bacterium]MBR2599001.1 F0F1 ATP synthase subunit B [Clostridiales bacterium]